VGDYGEIAFGRMAALAVGLALSVAAGPAAAQARDLADLSLEELGNVEVTSVSGRAEPLSGAAASIYVITHDDIRRSGATSLPEALRLAPNLQVARIDAKQYAISARGFNSAIANKLLVLIDGRTVYTPLFSGVFWDMQDVMLEDVERIEVISGPGATLWGANAVNGVINVITRAAGDTQGSLLSAGSGDHESGAAVRHGGRLGADGRFRVYARGRKLQNTELRSGAPVADRWEQAQAGFRADWRHVQGVFTLQGDAYGGKGEQRGTFLGLFPLGRVEISGANLLARWTRRNADGSDLRVQAYYDRTDREDAAQFSPKADIFDLDVQQAVPLGTHKLLWGGGYRRARDEVTDGLFFGLQPARKTLDWVNLFVQDEIALADNLQLTLGIKLENNDYTGTESLPSARLAWKASPAQLWWTGLSRAVRAPSRIDREIMSPPPGSPLTAFIPAGSIIISGQGFVSEVADVLELGWRGQLSRDLTLSATAFHYEWDKLRSGQPAPAFVQNMIEGRVYGMETWAAWQAAETWRVSAGLTTLRKHLRLKPGSTDPDGPVNLGNDPDYQWVLRSSHNLAPRQELDVMLRRVDELPDPAVPAYVAFDLRYGWRARPDLEVSLTLQNLFDPSHPEFGAAAERSEFARGAYLKARWTP
jgi:iron complex outermembrane receptor protein